MIEKKYLFNNKDNNYVTVYIKQPTDLGLSAVYESLFSVLDPEINPNEIYIVDYQISDSGFLSVILDVDDMDFSEFED